MPTYNPYRPAGSPRYIPRSYNNPQYIPQGNQYNQYNQGNQYNQQPRTQYNQYNQGNQYNQQPRTQYNQTETPSYVQAVTTGTGGNSRRTVRNAPMSRQYNQSNPYNQYSQPNQYAQYNQGNQFSQYNRSNKSNQYSQDKQYNKSRSGKLMSGYNAAAPSSDPRSNLAPGSYSAAVKAKADGTGPWSLDPSLQGQYVLATDLTADQLAQAKGQYDYEHRWDWIKPWTWGRDKETLTYEGRKIVNPNDPYSKYSGLEGLRHDGNGNIVRESTWREKLGDWIAGRKVTNQQEFTATTTPSNTPWGGKAYDEAIDPYNYHHQQGWDKAKKYMAQPHNRNNEYTQTAPPAPAQTAPAGGPYTRAVRENTAPPAPAQTAPAGGPYTRAVRENTAPPAPAQEADNSVPLGNPGSLMSGYAAHTAPPAPAERQKYKSTAPTTTDRGSSMGAAQAAMASQYPTTATPLTQAAPAATQAPAFDDSAEIARASRQPAGPYTRAVRENTAPAPAAPPAPAPTSAPAERQQLTYQQMKRQVEEQITPQQREQAGRMAMEQDLQRMQQQLRDQGRQQEQQLMRVMR